MMQQHRSEGLNNLPSTPSFKLMSGLRRQAWHLKPACCKRLVCLYRRHINQAQNRPSPCLSNSIYRPRRRKKLPPFANLSKLHPLPTQPGHAWVEWVAIENVFDGRGSPRRDRLPMAKTKIHACTRTLSVLLTRIPAIVDCCLEERWQSSCPAFIRSLDTIRAASFCFRS